MDSRVTSPISPAHCASDSWLLLSPGKLMELGQPHPGMPYWESGGLSRAPSTSHTLITAPSTPQPCPMPHTRLRTAENPHSVPMVRHEMGSLAKLFSKRESASDKIQEKPRDVKQITTAVTAVHISLHINSRRSHKKIKNHLPVTMVRLWVTTLCWVCVFFFNSAIVITI